MPGAGGYKHKCADIYIIQINSPDITLEDEWIHRETYKTKRTHTIQERVEARLHHARHRLGEEDLWRRVRLLVLAPRGWAHVVRVRDAVILVEAVARR